LSFKNKIFLPQPLAQLPAMFWFFNELMLQKIMVFLFSKNQFIECNGEDGTEEGDTSNSHHFGHHRV